MFSIDNYNENIKYISPIGGVRKILTRKLIFLLVKSTDWKAEHVLWTYSWKNIKL